MLYLSDIKLGDDRLDMYIRYNFRVVLQPLMLIILTLCDD